MNTRFRFRRGTIACGAIFIVAVAVIAMGGTRTYFSMETTEGGQSVQYYVQTDDATPDECQVAAFNENGDFDVYSTAFPPEDLPPLSLIDTGGDAGDFPFPYLSVVLGDPGDMEGEM